MIFNGRGVKDNIKYDTEKRGRLDTMINMKDICDWGYVYFLGLMRFSPMI